MKETNEKPKPPLVKAEVIDHFISLHMGDNVYKPFFKGAIVDIEPVTFRNLERKGRVVRAGASRTGDSDAGVADVRENENVFIGSACAYCGGNDGDHRPDCSRPLEKKRRKTKTAPPK